MTLPSVHKARADQRRARKNYQEMESLIEVILEHPEKSRAQQAALANISVGKATALIDTPEFDLIRQERLSQLIDPILRESLEKNLLTTSLKATQVISDKLEIEPTMNEALATLKVTTQALGLHNRGDAKPAINNNIQIAWLPPQN